MRLPASARQLRVNRTTRYVLVVVCVLIALHSILAFTHEEYGRATSLSNIASQLSWPHRNGTGDFESLEKETLTSAWAPEATQTETETETGVDDAEDSATSDDSPSDTSPSADTPRKANATLLMLARNSELEKAAQSVRELEEKFNFRFNYPWIFLNEVEFSDEFKANMTELASGQVTFGVIPSDHWYQPEWIDEERATEGRNRLVEADVIYGGSVSYRNMCRFNSGFFYRHPLLQQYKWYWRVEPDVHFYCYVDNDPFLYMEEHNKTYGFTISLYEFEATIPTLWQTVKNFTTEYPQFVAENNAMGFLSEDGGESYNLCHFWSNFEIADMDFWRGEAYTKFFEYLDATGGFYYERWGDAPVHSIAASLFLPKERVHFFDEIGYFHNPFTHCTINWDLWHNKGCTCSSWMSFDYQQYSCKRRWDLVL
ncbi:glycosyltransferase family 15 protein [Gelatoporia subvermispora B]|uniref:Glycosyltransferase family 15 protein n=1 Tax=Ceriporiopsis subvermispora (strain B) TaxID=914234 RepID=M2PIR0_CERS8|nr:glycosyltransferase family 15 protein [Gelatoporia subvermispora B]